MLQNLQQTSLLFVGEVADGGGEGVDGDVVDVGDAVVVGAVIVRAGEDVANGGDDAPAVP